MGIPWKFEILIMRNEITGENCERESSLFRFCEDWDRFKGSEREVLRRITDIKYIRILGYNRNESDC